MVWCGIEKYVACSLQEKIYWCNQINRVWVQMAAQDPGIMASIMAAGCRHIDMVSGTNVYQDWALKYHAEAVASLRESLAKEAENPSDITIVKTICLATEAVSETFLSLAVLKVQPEVGAHILTPLLCTYRPRSTTHP
jgi:hypothetical protein